MNGKIIAISYKISQGNYLHLSLYISLFLFRQTFSQVCVRLLRHAHCCFQSLVLTFRLAGKFIHLPWNQRSFSADITTFWIGSLIFKLVSSLKYTSWKIQSVHNEVRNKNLFLHHRQLAKNLYKTFKSNLIVILIL